MKLVGAIVVLVVVPLVVMAVHGSSPWLARKLVRQAARRLPEPHGERYAEEWQAELAAMPDGGLTTLVFALCIRLRVGTMERRLKVRSISRSEPQPQPEQLAADAEGWHVVLKNVTAHDAAKVSVSFQDALKATGSEHLENALDAMRATSVETHEMRITRLARGIRVSYRRTAGIWRRRRR